MAGTLLKIAGPAFLGSSVGDVYTPPASTLITIINQIHLSNVTSGAVTFTLYVGATGGTTAGTEIEKGYSIAANSDRDMFLTPGLVMKSTDFLTGLASAGSSITITVMGQRIAALP